MKDKSFLSISGLVRFTPEKHALRAISRKAGFALLAVCVLQLAVSPIAFLRPQLPATSDALWLSLLAVLSGLTIAAGALAGKKLFGSEPQRREIRKAGAGESAALVVAGAALCMAGNFVGSLVENLAGRAGIEFHGGPGQAAPQGLPGLLLMLLTVGLLPAVTEELLLRGVILPPLQAFGDGFAVTGAAALFALLHQNMEQAPMAFVSGLALGWVYVRGGRLILPMAVHAWNNTAAVLLSLAPDRAADIYALGLGALGLLCLLALYLRRPAPERHMCALSPGKRALHFFFGSVPMVMALGYFIVVIVLNTKAG